MLRLSSYLALACAALLISTHAAAAEDVKWTVAEASGAVSVVAPMAASHQVTKGEALAPGATVTTGADGKVVLGDGKTVITVSSNSRLTMPADSSDTMTRFAQDLGSVFFKVEKRPSQHFEVVTPLIAAVVKGTQFTVTAGATEHAVDVTEGLVEVVAMSGGQKELVPAGHAARVLSVAPSKLQTADAATGGATTATGAITRTIGAEPLNYAMVTDGLVAATPAVTGLTTVGLATAKTTDDGGSSATDEGISATTDGAIVAVDIGTGAAGGVVADVDVGLGDAGGGGGVTVGADAGAGSGGSGGVGAVVDVGTGPGGSTGTGGTVDVGVGSIDVGIGVGVVGGSTPGTGSGSGGSGGIGIGVGVGTGGSGGSGGIGIGGGSGKGGAGDGGG